MAASFGVNTPQSKFTFAHDSIVAAIAADTDPQAPKERKTRLYEHQTACLTAIKEWFQDPQNGEIALAIVPTGGGKSGIAVLAPYILNTARVLVITPSTEITRQLELDFCGGLNQVQQRILPFMVRYHVARREDQRLFVESGFAAHRPIDSGPKLVQQMESFNLVISNAHKLSPLHSTKINLDEVPRDFDLIIVDEAHHYPAETWKQVIDHFVHSKKLFLTATPYHRGSRIKVNNVEIPICYEIGKQQLIDAGVIRNLSDFVEVPDGDLGQQAEYERVADRLSQILHQHDELDGRHKHQAMVLTTTTADADEFADAANKRGLTAGAYHQGSSDAHLAKFQSGEFRVLAVCGRLLEGFDQKTVSVAVILRNVAEASRVLFTQFVGRAVRKIDSADPVPTVVLSHAKHKQRKNFDAYRTPQIALVEPVDDEP